MFYIGARFIPEDDVCVSWLAYFIKNHGIFIRLLNNNNDETI